MSESGTQSLYEKHHKDNRTPGFSILKDERGVFFAKYIGTGKKVLDIGCRDGALTQAFTEGNTVTGVDIDEEALRRASELGIRTIPMDLMGDWHELKGEKFEAVVAGELLEHLFYPKQIVKKVRRHLVPGGIFVASVPNAFSLKNRLRYLKGSKRHTPLSDPTHINQFSAKDFEHLFSGVFDEVSIDGLGRYPALAHLSPNLFAFDLVVVAR